MDNKEKIKSILLYVSLGIVFFSGFQLFIKHDILDQSLLTYSVKGFSFAFLGILLSTFFYKAKKKKIIIIPSIMSILGYCYTFYYIFKLGISLSMFDIGFYLYFLSLITFVISMFIPDYNEGTDNIKEEKINEKINGKFYVCNYIRGLKNVSDIYKSVSLLVKKDSEDYLEVNIKSEEEIKIKIKINDLKKIIVSKSVIVNYSDNKKEDYTMEAQYLSGILMGSFGAVSVILLNDLYKSNYSGSKANLNTVFKTELIYEKDKEENRLVFQSSKDPIEFFDEFKNILEIKEQ